MANGKRRTASRTKAAKERQKAVKDRQVRDTVAAICLLGLAACIYVCFAAPAAAPLCGFVHRAMFGLLGVGAYLFPAALIFAGLLLIFRHRRVLSKFGVLCLFIVLFSSFINVVRFPVEQYRGQPVGDYIEALFEGGAAFESGGVIGGALAVPLTLLAGRVITGILIFVCMLAALALVTGLTFANFIKTPEERRAIREQRRQRAAELDRLEDEAAQEAAEKVSVKAAPRRTPAAPAPARRPYLVNEVSSSDVDETISRISEQYLKDRDAAAEPHAAEAQAAEAQAAAVSAPGAKPADADKVTGGDIAQAKQEVEDYIDRAQAQPEEPYEFPPIDLLAKGRPADKRDVSAELHKVGEKLVQTLRMFNVETHVVDASRGPAVTRYELSPEAGVRISRITNLADDIALNLAAKGVRIEAPIPGKAAIGIEVPNLKQETVNLRTVLDSEEFRRSESKLSAALGKDICGKNVVINIEKMPHLLVAGATGMGKSVCINSMLVSFLYKARPDEVKLILVDPKMVEFNVYRGIPHLLIPVVTDPKKAAGALSWAVVEMEARYEKLARKNVRDIYGYNRNLAEGEKKLPQIVIVIDELADLMMASPKEVEESIIRLAQKARAAGMHLIIATQRPSSDVVTGLIKANIPSRIALAVSNGINSRIILDELGAEKLLGRGDMLYDPIGAVKPMRVQGCFVSDKEVEDVVEFVKNNSSVAAKYDDEIIQSIERLQQEQQASSKGHSGAEPEGGETQDDEMLEKAVDTVVELGQASTSMLQRRVGLGYARAARLIDIMEQRGYVGPYQGSKPREVLISKEEWQQIKMNSSGGGQAVPERVGEDT